MHLPGVIVGLLLLSTFVSAKCPKRGMAYTFPSPSDMAAVKNGISWWVNWDSKPANSEQSAASLGIEFVPMVWGQKSFQPTAPVIPAGSKFLLGFNEPNFFAQSNMSPNTAASLWPRVQQVGAHTKLVSPALNYCGGGCWDTDPFVYLDNFFASCKGCRVDYIAFHWYGCTAASLQSILNKYKKYGKKLWITEFACGPWDASYKNTADFQIAYMKQAVSIFEKDPMVFRYAWFTGRSQGTWPNGILQAAPGKLSALGTVYLSQPCGAPVAAALSDTSSLLVDNVGGVSNDTPMDANMQATLIVVGTILLVVAVLVVSAILLVVSIFKNRVESP